MWYEGTSETISVCAAVSKGLRLVSVQACSDVLVWRDNLSSGQRFAKARAFGNKPKDRREMSEAGNVPYEGAAERIEAVSKSSRP